MTRRRAAVPKSSPEHAVIARLFALASRQMTKLGHLGLVNYLESRGGCSRERCAPSCLEMQATLDAALDVLDAPEAEAAPSASSGQAEQAEMWGNEVAG